MIGIPTMCLSIIFWITQIFDSFEIILFYIHHALTSLGDACTKRMDFCVKEQHEIIKIANQYPSCNPSHSNSPDPHYLISSTI